MKKLVLALFVGLMVVAGTASFAAAEITVGGEMEVRYDLWKDINLNNQVGQSETQSFWAQRVLLNVDAKITEGLEAFVEMDTEDTEFIWGGQRHDFDVELHNPNVTPAIITPTSLSGSSFQGGANVKNNRNGAGGLNPGVVNDLNHQQSTMRIKQAWINFMVPGLPMGMKIGHQPLALGHGIFLDTHRQGTDSILLYAKPMPQMLLAGVYIKGFDSSPTRPIFHGDEDFGDLFRTNTLVTGQTGSIFAPMQAGWNHDADFYAALCNYTWAENNTAGVNFTYVHDNALLKNTVLNILGEQAFPENNGILVAQVPIGDHDVTAENLALVADGTMMGINYKGEVDFLHIKADKLFKAVDQAVGGFDFGSSNYTVNAWAFMLGGSGKVGPCNIALEAAYGTGNDNDDANILYDPSGRNLESIHDNNDHAYFTPYGATSYNYAFLYNDKIGQGPLGAGGGFGFGDGFGGFGLANTGYVKLSVAGSPMDRLNCNLDVLALNASAQNIKDQKRFLGIELDGDVNYKIYDNLLLDVKGGVFFPGPWYDFPGLVDPTLTSNGNDVFNRKLFVDADDPDTRLKRNTAFGMETKLSVKF